MKNSKLEIIGRIAKETISQVKRMRGTTMLWGAFAQEATGNNPLKKNLEISGEERVFQKALVQILEEVTGKSLTPTPSTVHLKALTFSENSCWPHFACNRGYDQCGLSDRDWLEAVEVRATTNLKKVTCQRCRKILSGISRSRIKSGDFILPNGLQVIL